MDACGVRISGLSFRHVGVGLGLYLGAKRGARSHADFCSRSLDKNCPNPWSLDSKFSDYNVGGAVKAARGCEYSSHGTIVEMPQVVDL